MAESQKLTSEELLYEKLREPFDIKYINWKINNYNKDKNKAQITFHIDARAVQHKLNQELGLGGWSFTFQPLENNTVVQGKLELLIGDKKVVKEDAGYCNNKYSEEKLKDAVSDGLKRCAVHIGIGHFLYALPMLWIDLNKTEQKYLDKEQDKYISNWLEQNLKPMRKVKNKETETNAEKKQSPKPPKKEEPENMEMQDPKQSKKSGIMTPDKFATDILKRIDEAEDVKKLLGVEVSLKTNTELIGSKSTVLWTAYKKKLNELTKGGVK